MQVVLLHDENVVSIYPYLPILGFVSGITVLGYCLGLVLFPFTNHYQGNLMYISDGMNMYCGWSGAVLGSCGMFIALCELVAALHTADKSSFLLLAILVQAPAWCILVGVSGTGWAIHYTALVLMLLSSQYFHWGLASAHPMARLAAGVYQRANLFTLFNLALFFLSFLMVHSSTKGTTTYALLMDVTVSLEITLMICMSVQTFCLSWVLLQYQDIHILFHTLPPTGTSETPSIAHR